MGYLGRGARHSDQRLHLPPTPGPGAGPWAPYCLQGQSLWAAVSGKGPQTLRCPGLQCAFLPGWPGAALGAPPPAVTEPTSFAPDWYREWETGRDRPSGPHPPQALPRGGSPKGGQAGTGGSGRQPSELGPGCGQLADGWVPWLLGREENHRSPGGWLLTSNLSALLCSACCHCGLPAAGLSLWPPGQSAG